MPSKPSMACFVPCIYKRVKCSRWRWATESDSISMFSAKSGLLRHGGIVGLKVSTYWPSNRTTRGLRSHGSTTLLLDDERGPSCTDSSEPSDCTTRTAAADGVAVRQLSRRRLAHRRDRGSRPSSMVRAARCLRSASRRAGQRVEPNRFAWLDPSRRAPVSNELGLSGDCNCRSNKPCAKRT